MKKLTIVVALAFAFLLLAAACGENHEVRENTEPKIYLYGEVHANKNIIEKEYELWHDYYHNHGMRHLFIESSYYTAELLNCWMKAEEDDIFEQVFNNQKGTASYNEHTYNFYHKIKQECPETVFHGTDIGHQYWTTGYDFLKKLREEGKEESKEYTIAEENITQGQKWYENIERDYDFRENAMVENFRREFDALEGESIMGIYGAAHVVLGEKASHGTVDNMATQLKSFYGDDLYVEDLRELASIVVDAIRIDNWEINGKRYDAEYYGEVDISQLEKYQSREFWKILEPGSDFDDWESTGEILPYDNYPVNKIEVGDVFMVRYLRKDGGEEWRYYKADGTVWNDLESTRVIVSPDSK